ncbi:kelch-like protein 23 [Culex pipiens pallens]|uniref:kelch-like protein 23 n=1 Tax=Culex pipiens pallens TaxID=42434 RepID=UPI0022AAD4D3|nr:kelch-like protein 23 [Culex pipiens pallens]
MRALIVTSPTGIFSTNLHNMSSLDDTAQEQLQLGSCYQDQLLRFVNNSFLADVSFLVGADAKRFYAHRVLLVHCSEVFSEMFRPRAETTKKRKSVTTVIVKNVKPSVFLEMLYFIYCGDCEVTRKNVFDLLLVASKYLIYYLQKKCERFLMENIEIVLEEYVAASKRIDLRVQQLCLSQISSNIVKVCQLPQFLKLPGTLVLMIFKQKFRHGTDRQLMDAVDRWRASQKDQDQANRVYRIVESHSPAGIANGRVSSDGTADRTSIRALAVGPTDQVEASSFPFEPMQPMSSEVTSV